MTNETKRPKSLREKLDAGENILMCGVWDVYSSYAAEKAGFDAIAAQSMQIAAARGLPDIGILSPDQLLQITASITRRAHIPVIIDGEQGWGDVASTQYWIREFERIGVSGIHMDDYPPGQKCCQTRQSGVGLIPMEVEHTAAAIRAAVDARSSREFVVIGRSSMSARNWPATEETLKDIVERHKIYKDAGADVLFPTIAGKGQLEWLRRYCKEAPAGPKMMQIVSTNTFPATYPEYQKVPLKEIFDMGVQIINIPLEFALASTRYLMEIGQEIVKSGSLRVLEGKVPNEEQWEDIMGYNEVMNTRKKILENAC